MWAIAAMDDHGGLRQSTEALAVTITLDAPGEGVL
ncbi:hypothetical protein SAMN05444680_102223 [Variovorax sp. YR216]|nr:hypothetical protein SAMN05444680_102223 [Variovorax sp. YR216]